MNINHTEILKNSTNNIQRIIFVFLILAGSSACSKDDAPSEPKVEELIIGKWFLKHRVPIGGGASEALGDCEKRSYLEFDTAHRAIMENFSRDESLCISNLSLWEYGLFSENRRIVFTTSSGESTTADILNLDRTILAIESGGVILQLER